MDAMPLIRATFVGLLCLATGASQAARAAPGMILGDSIGVGLALAGGVKSLAHNSVRIGADGVLREIASAPAGTVMFISLGTNDAVGSIKGVEARIDRVVAAIDASGAKAVWVGPVCVIQPWNETVVKLDALLRRKLAGRVTYVSLADDAYCDASIRGHDGVHFTAAGYHRLWAKARAAAGEAIDGGTGPETAKTVKRKRKKQSQKTRHAAALLSKTSALFGALPHVAQRFVLTFDGTGGLLAERRPFGLSRT
jgi:hypothetical protein